MRVCITLCVCASHYACVHYIMCVCIYIVHVHIHSYVENFEGSWLPRGGGQNNNFSTHINSKRYTSAVAWFWLLGYSDGC